MLGRFTAIEEWTWYTLQKKYRFLSYKAVHIFLWQHWIFMFRLEWSIYSAHPSEPILRVSPQTWSLEGRFSLLPAQIQEWFGHLTRKPGFLAFEKTGGLDVSKTHFAFFLVQTLKWDWNHDAWPALVNSEINSEFWDPSGTRTGTNSYWYMNQHAVGAGPEVAVVLSVILDTVTSVFPAVCPSFVHRIILKAIWGCGKYIKKIATP